MVVHKIAAIILNEKRFLAIKERGLNILLTPGGKVEGKETPEETLRRELKEELNVDLVSLKSFGTFNDKTHDGKEDLTLETYFVEINGIFQPKSEVESLFWVNSRFRHNLVELSIPMKKYIIPKLLEMNLIE